MRVQPPLDVLPEHVGEARPRVHYRQEHPSHREAAAAASAAASVWCEGMGSSAVGARALGGGRDILVDEGETGQGCCYAAAGNRHQPRG